MAVRHDAGWPRLDHYAVLGVDPSASEQQIASAYRRLVRRLHPDAQPGQPAAVERFAEVVDAYAVLRDPARRAAYDAERARRAAGAPAVGPVAVRVRRTATPGGTPWQARAEVRLSLGGDGAESVFRLLDGFLGLLAGGRLSGSGPPRGRRRG